MSTLNKILVSACLLGEKVNYLATDNKVSNSILSQWQQEGRLVPLCPEVAGGLPIPRPACEIQGEGSGLAVLNGAAQVISIDGQNCSQEFLKGAQIAVNLCQEHNIKMAILKARSPSCGSKNVYNGAFNKTLIEGMGTTAAALTQKGVKCFSELTLEEAHKFLSKLEL